MAEWIPSPQLPTGLAQETIRLANERQSPLKAVFDTIQNLAGMSIKNKMDQNLLQKKSEIETEQKKREGEQETVELKNRSSIAKTVPANELHVAAAKALNLPLTVGQQIDPDLANDLIKGHVRIMAGQNKNNALMDRFKEASKQKDRDFVLGLYKAASTDLEISEENRSKIRDWLLAEGQGQSPKEPAKNPASTKRSGHKKLKLTDPKTGKTEERDDTPEIRAAAKKVGLTISE